MFRTTDEMVKLFANYYNFIGLDPSMRWSRNFFNASNAIEYRSMPENSMTASITASMTASNHHDVPNPVMVSDTVEKIAQQQRSAATHSEAKCTWNGTFPTKVVKNPIYSTKVFLGGVPYDITDISLKQEFAKFGAIQVQWPTKSARNWNNGPVNSHKLGYVYIIFESEKQVQTLLESCTLDFSEGGKWYFALSSLRSRSKEAQVIPWCTADSVCIKLPNITNRLENYNTVFVGALHGMLSADGLAQIMDDLFGGVVYAQIDTDKHKYPIGSGRVSFNNQKSFFKAIESAFIEIKSQKFNKRIQVDPFIEANTFCDMCQLQSGPIFCRDISCFRYYCTNCWNWYHSVESVRNHRPLTKKQTPL